MRKFILCLFFCSFLGVSGVLAQTPYDEIRSKYCTEYPRTHYIVGVGEKKTTGNYIQDRRVAEILARLEIAKEIKVRVAEEMIDIRCEGMKSKIYRDENECRDRFYLVTKETVDEFLQGSRIVSVEEKDGVLFAIAVLARDKTIEGLDKNIKDSIHKTRESIEKAKKGNKDSIEKAKEEYTRGIVYEKEKEIIEGVKSKARKAFEDLEKEIEDLK